MNKIKEFGYGSTRTWSNMEESKLKGITNIKQIKNKNVNEETINSSTLKTLNQLLSEKINENEKVFEKKNKNKKKSLSEDENVSQEENLFTTININLKRGYKQILVVESEKIKKGNIKERNEEGVYNFESKKFYKYVKNEDIDLNINKLLFVRDIENKVDKQIHVNCNYQILKMLGIIKYDKVNSYHFVNKGDYDVLVNKKYNEVNDIISKHQNRLNKSLKGNWKDKKEIDEKLFKEKLYENFVKKFNKQIKNINNKIKDCNKFSQVIELVNEKLAKRNFFSEVTPNSIKNSKNKELSKLSYKYCKSLLIEERKKFVEKIRTIRKYEQTKNSDLNDVMSKNNKKQIYRYYIFNKNFLDTIKNNKLNYREKHTKIFKKKFNQIESKNLEWLHAHRDVSQAILETINIQTNDSNKYKNIKEKEDIISKFLKLCALKDKTIWDILKLKNEIKFLINNYQSIERFFKLLDENRKNFKIGEEYFNHNAPNDQKKFKNYENELFKKLNTAIDNSTNIINSNNIENIKKVYAYFINSKPELWAYYIELVSKNKNEKYTKNGVSTEKNTELEQVLKKIHDLKISFEEIVIYHYYNNTKDWNINRNDIIEDVNKDLWKNFALKQIEEFVSIAYITNKILHASDGNFKQKEFNEVLNDFKVKDKFIEECKKINTEFSKKISTLFNSKNKIMIEKNFSNSDYFKKTLTIPTLINKEDYILPQYINKPAFKKLMTFEDFKGSNLEENQLLYSYHALIYKYFYQQENNVQNISEDNFTQKYEEYQQYNQDFIFKSFYKKYNDLSKWEKKKYAEKNTCIQRFSECLRRNKYKNEYLKWYKGQTELKFVENLKLKKMINNVNNDTVTTFLMLQSHNNFTLSTLIQKMDLNTLSYETPDFVKQNKILDLDQKNIELLKTLLDAQIQINKKQDKSSEEENMEKTLLNICKRYKIIPNEWKSSNLDTDKFMNVYANRYFISNQHEELVEFYFNEMKKYDKFKDNCSFTKINDAITKFEDEVSRNTKYKNVQNLSSLYKEAKDKNLQNDIKGLIIKHRELLFYKNMLHLDILNKHINIIKELDRVIMNYLGKYNEIIAENVKATNIRNELRHVHKKTTLETWEEKINLLRELFDSNGYRHIKNSIMTSVKSVFKRHNYFVEFSVLDKKVNVGSEKVTIKHYFKLNNITSKTDYNEINILSDKEIAYVNDVFVEQEYVK